MISQGAAISSLSACVPMHQLCMYICWLEFEDYINVICAYTYILNILVEKPYQRDFGNSKAIATISPSN